MAKKGIAVDGKKIKELRAKAQLSQKALAATSNVEIRTLQRAEKGEPVTPVMVNQIATALKVNPETLSLPDDEKATDDAGVSDITKDPNRVLVRFKQSLSAQEVIDTLRHTRVKYRFNVDPTEEVAEQIAQFIELLNDVLSDSSTYESAADLIRAYGKVNTSLKKLADENIYFFAGKYSDIAREWRSTGPYASKWVIQDVVRSVAIFSNDEANQITSPEKITTSDDVEKFKERTDKERFADLRWGFIDDDFDDDIPF